MNSYTVPPLMHGERKHRQRWFFEEIGEFMDALCKYTRGRVPAGHVAEEIADVQIMLEQMTVLFEVESRVQEYREYKLARLAERLQKAESGGVYADGGAAQPLAMPGHKRGRQAWCKVSIPGN